MKHIVCLGIGLVFAMLSDMGRANESFTGYAWEYNRYRIASDGTRKPLGQIKYYLVEDALRIEKEDQTVIIDYSAQKLFRCSTRQKVCAVFNIGNNIHSHSYGADKNEQFRKAMIDLLGSIRVTSGQESKKITHILCRKLFVTFGNRMNLSRMVVPIEFEALGRKFRTYSAVYWVSKDITAFTELLKMDGRRKPFFESNPFLRQIDPLGLFHILGGFPLRIEQPNKDHHLTVLSLKSIEARELDPHIFKPPPDFQYQVFTSQN